MLNIIKNYVYNDDQFTRKMAIPQDNFLDLVNLVLTTTWFTFDSQFYQQTDGITMGGPATSTTVEIYIQAHEQTAISMALHAPKVWEQFFDDVYSILKCMHLKIFSTTSQQFHKFLNIFGKFKIDMYYTYGKLKHCTFRFYRDFSSTRLSEKNISFWKRPIFSKIIWIILP